MIAENNLWILCTVRQVDPWIDYKGSSGEVKTLKIFWFVMLALTFRRIQGSIKDEKKKKFVTGEWFSEVKAKRFQEDLEGPDLLRASIRRKKGKVESKYVSVQLQKIH